MNYTNGGPSTANRSYRTCRRLTTTKERMFILAIPQGIMGNPAKQTKIYKGFLAVGFYLNLFGDGNSAHILYRAGCNNNTCNRFYKIRANRYKFNVVCSGRESGKIKLACGICNGTDSISSHYSKYFRIRSSWRYHTCQSARYSIWYCTDNRL